MTVDYSINYDDFQRLEEKMEKIPENIEGIINSYLHKEGATKTVGDITNLIPISKPFKPKLIHARTSKWSKIEKINLGFTVKTKGGAANKPRSFGYLVFPNEGRGPRNPLERRFMERGLQRVVPEIIEDLIEVADEEIRKELE